MQIIIILFILSKNIFLIIHIICDVTSEILIMAFYLEERKCVLGSCFYDFICVVVISIVKIYYYFMTQFMP